MVSTGGASLTRQADGSWFVERHAPGARHLHRHRAIAGGKAAGGAARSACRTTGCHSAARAAGTTAISTSRNSALFAARDRSGEGGDAGGFFARPPLTTTKARRSPRRRRSTGRTKPTGVCIRAMASGTRQSSNSRSRRLTATDDVHTAARESGRRAGPRDWTVPAFGQWSLSRRPPCAAVSHDLESILRAPCQRCAPPANASNWRWRCSRRRTIRHSPRFPHRNSSTR